MTLSAAATTITGCLLNEPEPKDPINDVVTSTASFKLQPATSCQTLGEQIVNVATEQILQDRYENHYRDFAEDGGVNNTNAPAADPGAEGDASGDDSPDDYTTTNNQEAGVDEADFLKTDGDYIYTLSGRDLVIVDSWPANEASEVGRISLGEEGQQSTWPADMFLLGDKIAVFSHVYNYSDARDDSEDYSWRDGFQGTRVSVIDVSSRSEPRLERQLDIEGHYNNARMIDGDVYLVSNAQLQLPNNVYNIAWDENSNLPEAKWDADSQEIARLKGIARGKVRELVAQRISGTDVTDMLPRKRVYDSSGTQLVEAPMYSCTDMYIPSQLARLGVLNITHLDLSEKSNITSTGVLASGWTIYASQDSLYTAMSSGGWWWGWGWGSRSNDTHIHKFRLNTPDNRPEYAASGKVDGWLLNQFSMSEYQNHLRVATTDNEWSWDEQTGESTASGGNHLTILKEETGGLVETGSVRDLAPGEQIYSARMLGPKGYMVTFRQTDPLFTFDLSDPTNPKLEGELKINGFSSYMHPIDANHLLTIGQDADDEGRVTGVHLQIFDVSDMKNPKRTHQHLISTGDWSSWSEAMWDHHAFTYHAGKKILGVPMNIHDWSDYDGENFSGLLLFKIDTTTGISELGRIDHADMTSAYYCAVYNEDWACNTEHEDHHWWTSIRRSIFIEDYVYSISDIGMKINDMFGDQNELKALELLDRDTWR